MDEGNLNKTRLDKKKRKRERKTSSQHHQGAAGRAGSTARAEREGPGGVDVENGGEISGQQ